MLSWSSAKRPGLLTQTTLERWLDPSRINQVYQLDIKHQLLKAKTKEDAWQEGIKLARATRLRLDINATAPINKLASMIEERLAIPVIRVNIDTELAGAALTNYGARGIILNLQGINENPGTRRVTLAHELCHVLWDCDADLDRLKVDVETERDISSAKSKLSEYRAQAMDNREDTPSFSM